MNKQVTLDEMIADVEKVVEGVDSPSVIKKAMSEAEEKGIYLVKCRVSWRKKRGSKSTIGYAKGTKDIPLQVITINPINPLKDSIALSGILRHLGLTEGKYQDLRIETIYSTKQVGERSKQAMEQEENKQ